jgi:hypothetical protein
MVLTGENRSTRRKPCPNATLSAADITWTGMNTGIRILRLSIRWEKQGRSERHLNLEGVGVGRKSIMFSEAS